MWIVLAAAAIGASFSQPSFSDDDGYFFYTLASASYCTNKTLAAWDCVPCKRPGGATLLPSTLTVFFNSSTDARALTAVVGDRNANAKYIVLSWRGTETLHNWLEDAHFFKTDRGMSCDGCKVHSGFVDVWASLAPKIVPELKRLRVHHPLLPLVVVGHSLGGAVASVGEYILANDLGIDVSAVYTYGGPRVGNKQFADRPSPRAPLWRITHHRDIVPHLPPETLFGFQHSAREAFYINESHSFHLCDGTGEDNQCSRGYTIVSVSDHLNYYGETIGEDGCVPFIPPNASRAARLREAGEVAAARAGLEFVY